MTRRFAIKHAFTLLLLAIGLAGALVARWAGAPMPFMLGALAASAAMAGVFGAHYPKDYAFPMPVRLLFIGVIGVMIGAQVDPGLFTNAGGFVVSLGAVSLFVLASQFINMAIYYRIGGYDKATAWFSGSPGGLVEAVTMGEEAGGDVRVLTILQFLRIILVVSILPVALSIWNGAPVGSAAGLSLTRDGGGLVQLPLVLVLVLAGHVLGRTVRLPAGQLTGPLVAAAIVSWLGWASLDMPPWLLAMAQVVLGVHLGVRFHGVGRALLVKAVGMSLISVTVMLGLGLGLALAVGWATGIPLEVLIISYAPGGVTEMGLVAISLSANPTLVTMHHLFRITLTVLLLSLARRLGMLHLR
ncbi:MAG: AbrB family transcriptional regulator [Rhodobacteraceae bacterium]|nr:AbrB family transcriptional regulator [Paracoccaceae bacterium]